jgi:hypothetical protein
VSSPLDRAEERVRQFIKAWPSYVKTRELYSVRAKDGTTSAISVDDLEIVLRNAVETRRLMTAMAEDNARLRSAHVKDLMELRRLRSLVPDALK